MTIREMERKKRRSTRIFGGGVLGIAALIGVLAWAGLLDLFRQLP